MFIRDACVDVQAVKSDDQAKVEELVSEGQDLTRSDDVGQARIVTILISHRCHMCPILAEPDFKSENVIKHLKSRFKL